MPEVFADTGYWIALLNRRDNLHTKARELSNDHADATMKAEMMPEKEAHPNGLTGEQYHSALHDSDNVYHIDQDCSLARNIKKRCACTARTPRKPCPNCA